METPTMMHLEMRNRNQLPWTEETWKQIDIAVHYECQRTKVASKFLPIYPAPGATTIPSDTVLLSDRGQSVADLHPALVFLQFAISKLESST